MRWCWGWRCKVTLPLPLHLFPFLKHNSKPNFFIPTQKQRRSHTLSLPSPSPAIAAPTDSTPLQGDLVSYMVGQKKATEVAHLVWRHVLCKGDTAVDATCGNGYDTLAMLRMVADDESGRGCVLGMDIQRDAIRKTASLLDASLTPEEKRLVKLFNMCHSRMEEIVPEHNSVRLVAFNLGYLPGGITTASETTLLALEAAKRILAAGGLISLVVYVGHPGGSERSWVPSLCSVLFSLGIMWAVRYKMDVESHLEKLLAREEEEDGQLLRKCAEELKRKGLEFDLLCSGGPRA